MNWRPQSIVLMGGLFFLWGCAHAAVRTEVIPMADQSELYRLTNGDYEVVVAPATGRIVGYGPVGGPNLLWTNPRAPESGSPFKGWVNWGGDKVWIWPEGDWGKWTQAGAPPGDPAGSAYEVRSRGRTLWMTSPVVPYYGVRIVRKITIDESGSGVTIVNRLEQVTPALRELPVAPWTVTQVPAPAEIYGRLAEDAKPPGYADISPNIWPGMKVEGRNVTMPRPAKPWVKMGLDADMLAVPEGDLLFSITVLKKGNDAGPYQAYRRAQVFSDPDDSPFRPAGVPKYIEMEFTGPLRMLAVGESMSLTLRWKVKAIHAEK